MVSLLLQLTLNKNSAAEREPSRWCLAKKGIAVPRGHENDAQRDEADNGDQIRGQPHGQSLSDPDPDRVHDFVKVCIFSRLVLVVEDLVCALLRQNSYHSHGSSVTIALRVSSRSSCGSGPYGIGDLKQVSLNQVPIQHPNADMRVFCMRITNAFHHYQASCGRANPKPYKPYKPCKHYHASCGRAAVPGHGVDAESCARQCHAKSAATSDKEPRSFHAAPVFLCNFKGSIVVLPWGSYLEPYKVIPKGTNMDFMGNFKTSPISQSLHVSGQGAEQSETTGRTSGSRESEMSLR